MAGLKKIATSRGTIYNLPYDVLEVQKGLNIREDYGDVDELARQIAENGQKIPCKVHVSDDGTKAVIVDGHRRYKAIDIANKKYGASINTVSCINEERGANEETRIVDMFMMGSGKPLTLLEQAEAVKRLLGYNWKPVDIAKKIGKSQTCVSQLLTLLEASHELRVAVKEGAISTTAAIKLAAAPKTKQKNVLERVNTLTNINGVSKVKVKDVEKATKGAPSTISSKKIKTILTNVDTKIKTNENSHHWEDVKFGLQLALGIKSI